MTWNLNGLDTENPAHFVKYTIVDYEQEGWQPQSGIGSTPWWGKLTLKAAHPGCIGQVPYLTYFIGAAATQPAADGDGLIAHDTGQRQIAAPVWLAGGAKQDELQKH